MLRQPAASRPVDFRNSSHELGRDTVRRTFRVATRFETGAALASGRVAEIVRFPSHVTPRCRKSNDFRSLCFWR